MLNLYPSTLCSFRSVAEKETPYVIVTERHVQALWLEQKYFKNLQTAEGEPIHVLSPGIWNAEAGPDFLKAHLRIGANEWKGDIEIHLNEEDWFHHGHHQDERYESVVLHLAFWQPKNPKKLVRPNGTAIPSASFEKALTIPVGRLVQLIDLDLYPYKRFVGSGRCGRELFKNLSEEQIIAFFTSASYWRLDQKKIYLQNRFPFGMELAGGIALGLGYKHNAEAFADIFTYLLDFRDAPQIEFFAISLGISGFFEERFVEKWKHSSYYTFLKTVWEGNRSLITHQASLRLDHIRPFNHPIRRLAYLTKFMQDPKTDTLWPMYLETWAAFVEKGDFQKKSLLALRQTFNDLIPSYHDEYWNSHYTFEIVPKKKPLTLLGDDIKSAIVINTILPLLYSDIKKRAVFSEWNVFNEFYNSYGPLQTSKMKYLVHRFFGDTPKGALLDRARLEQGAYQLHKDFCIHFEASCEGCTFVERYHSPHSL